MSKLEGVADTLFIPLVSRIYVSNRFPDYFYDQMALSLESEIESENIKKNTSEYLHMASVARYYHLDSWTRKFLASYEKCNVINLGAGLETAYFRLNNKRDLFYEVDTSEVIENRRKVLGECENEFLIASDIFSLEWVKLIDTTLPSLFIVSGVFQYYQEPKILEFIRALKEAFPNGELIFDATNEKGLKFANKYVKKTGNTSAPMYFFVNDASLLAQKSSTTLIECRPFFEAARKMLAKRLKITTRLIMKIVDLSGRAILVHLKL
ncbi:MAG: class I SAM-dependent methyltransferase [Deltaproteobacteria bacterium]|jgi:O-methyltransferase involved in polyketide biosynthesis|nr:class I SAM-dependent methyltransferase [Deltaproteobacteria bacterium]